jgi:hypothetical protein
LRKTPALLESELEALGELLPEADPQASAMRAVTSVFLNRDLDRVAQIAVFR